MSSCSSQLWLFPVKLTPFEKRRVLYTESLSDSPTSSGKRDKGSIYIFEVLVRKLDAFSLPHRMAAWRILTPILVSF